MNNTQLNAFLRQRLHHHHYLESVSEEDEPFPYKISPAKEAVVGEWSLRKGKFTASPSEADDARYILMMPMVLPASSKKVTALIERFFSEACDTKNQRERTSLIIGINARRSLDASKLNRLDKLVRAWKWPNFSCGVVGFVWDRQYTLQKKIGLTMCIKRIGS